MRIEETFKKKRPVVSFEIFPPKRDTVLADIDKTLEVLCDLKPDYISVTFGAGGSATNNKTLELAKKIKAYGIEPMVHLTCINYNKVEIDEFIKQIEDAGVENILALRGDRNPDMEEREDFRYASDLIRYIKPSDKFSIAAAGYPECHVEARDKISDMRNLVHKVECGADFIITQLFFDNDKFYSFSDSCRMAGIDKPIEAGIMPVNSRSQIERMVKMCGATLTDKFTHALSKYENNKEALIDVGIAYAINQVIDLLAHDVDGIHLYTMNNPITAKRICDGIRNLI